MRTYFPAVILVGLALYVSVTAFQCGSAEMTTAKLAIQQKQFDKAEESLLRSVQKNDKDEEAWFLLGEVRYELKKYAEMNDAFTRALALSEVHKVEIHQYRLDVWAKQFNAGIDAYNQGKDQPAKYDEAIQRLQLASNILPDSMGTYRALALAHFAKKDYAGATATLENAIARNPKYIDGIRLLGQIHYSAGEEKRAAGDAEGASASFTRAATAYEGLYRMDPQSPENMKILIDAYTQSAQEEKALKLTRDCVNSDPTNRVCRYAYGVYLLQSAQYEQSTEQLKKAIDLDPTVDDQIRKDATYNLGVGYLNWGVAMKEEAEKKIEGKKGKDAVLDPSYKEKFKAAVPYLEQSAKTRGQDADLWQRLGQVYANLNMVEESKHAFEEFDRLTKGK
jgi:tetratricopeptide (TPR) repeat protein